MEQIQNAHKIAVQGAVPQITFWLDVSPEIVHIRRGIRDAGTPEDCRFEKAAQEFHDRVRTGYAELCDLHSDRFVRIDADGNIDEVWERMEEYLRDYFCNFKCSVTTSGLT